MRLTAQTECSRRAPDSRALLVPKDYGFVRIGAAVPPVFVAQPEKNVARLVQLTREAAAKGVQALVFPELCLTGYSCGELFNQLWLQHAALEGLSTFLQQTADMQIVVALGMPLRIDEQLFNVGVLCHAGRVLGIVPKSYIPGYKEFYEPRWFSPASYLISKESELFGEQVPTGTDILVQTNIPNLTLAVEICEDLFMCIPPSSLHAANGATVLLNLSASPDIISKAQYRRSLVLNQSARCNAAYVYVSSTSCIQEEDSGESTSDVVFAGDAMIADYGALVKEADRFSTQPQLIFADIDIERLMRERVIADSWGQTVAHWSRPYRHVHATLERIDATRQPFFHVDAFPFVPREVGARAERCRDILSIQAAGLAKRVRFVACQTGGTPVRVAVGVSGGLDSALALLVTCSAFDKLGWDRSNILGITMPGFGTTARTHNNAVALCRAVGVDFREISIRPAILQHLKDIGHEPCFRCLTCENAQARERTQILMDHGFVVGTGDLSEIALGWSTHNADQQSMYHVNAGVPKDLGAAPGSSHRRGWNSGRRNLQAPSRDPEYTELCRVGAEPRPPPGFGRRCWSF
jgi:NAD+ synthase (glutamine-hydrolysing)